MTCPVCSQSKDSGSHRACLFALFKDNRIQSIGDWERLCGKPKTTLKGWAVRWVPKQG